ncbi:MAG: hypothetical protein FWH57_08930 [Oscillospiraceae bacterium]|nr:hypothetical protein [Oscillospiraceae bacterium]
MSILSYLHILVLVPILSGAYKASSFVKYHANQGLVLGIAWVGYNILSEILKLVIRVPRYYFGVYVGQYTPGWLATIFWLLHIPFIVLAIMGIINANNGKAQPLPVIGGFTILK